MAIVLLLCVLPVDLDPWVMEMNDEILVRGGQPLADPRYHGLWYEGDGGPTDERAPVLEWLTDRCRRSIAHVAARADTVRTVRFKPAVWYEQGPLSLLLQPGVKFGTDSLPPRIAFKDIFSADYDRALVRLDWPSFGFLVGRERTAIGPSPRANILLSGQGAPLDWLQGYARTGAFMLSFMMSELDPMTCTEYAYIGDTLTALIQARRFLFVRRLDFQPWSWLNLSFTEAALAGGEDYHLTPYHWNPLVFMHTLQYNWAQDANIMFHLDGRLVWHGWSAYGALLVDDFQLDPDPNNEPNHLGGLVGVEIADLVVPRSFLVAEYAFATRYLYTHFHPYQRFEYRGHPLGSPAGPDHDVWFGRYTYHAAPHWDCFGEGLVTRKGEVLVTSPWPIPEPRTPGTVFPEDNFLSGTVETTISGSIGVRWYPNRAARVGLSFGYAICRNHRHLPGADDRTFTFCLEAAVDRLPPW